MINGGISGIYRFDCVSEIIQAGPANISSAWVRRKYPKHFVSKLLDALEEETETEVWIDMSHDCKYIDDHQYNTLVAKYQEIAGMLASMSNNPDKFCR